MLYDKEYNIINISLDYAEAFPSEKLGNTPASGSERDLYKERVKPILDIFFECLLVVFFYLHLLLLRFC